jgi:hypothetical protein
MGIPRFYEARFRYSRFDKRLRVSNNRNGELRAASGLTTAQEAVFTIRWALACGSSTTIPSLITRLGPL